MKITKNNISRLVRFIISIASALYILIVVNIVNRTYMYIYARWKLDIIENSIETGGIPIEFIIMIMIWHYILGFAIIGLIWKYIGLPHETAIGKLYKRFKYLYIDGQEIK